MAQPASSPSHRFRTEWLALGVFLLIIGVAFVQALYREHISIEEHEGARLLGQAKVIDENLTRQLQGVNFALKSVRDDFESGSSAPGESDKLKLLSDAMPGVGGLAVLDAQGTMIDASRAELIGGNFEQREYFLVPRRNTSRAVLYVSSPFKTATGRGVIVVSRALTNARGEFAGVVAATLDPDYFNVVLRSVLYASDMRTTLIHGDGKVFLSEPSTKLAFGTDLARPDSFFSLHRRTGQVATLTAGSTFVTGEERMIAMRDINAANLQMDRPLVVSVSRDPLMVFLPWRTKSTRYAAFYALLVLGAALAVGSSQRRRRTWDRMTAAAAKDRQQGAERVELALRGADLGLWDLHLASRHLVVNARERELLGYAPGDEFPKFSELRGLIHPDDRAVVHASLRSHIKGVSATHDCQYRMRHRAGHWVWIHNRAMVVERDAAGVPARLIGTHLDITERKQTEAELARAAELLRLSEERMAVALDGSGLALFDWDVRGDRIYQSAHAALMRGEPAVESTLSAAQVKAYVHPEDLDAMLTRMQQVLSGALPRYDAEYRIRRSSGGWLWIRARGRVVQRDKNGWALRLAGTYADITERKAAEQRLRHLAEFDALTDLPNRTLFYDRLQQAMLRAARGKPMALLYLDIDHFKTVNDKLGHEAGDQLLKVFATRMRASVRQSDTVARLAGDEFTIILEGVQGLGDAQAKANLLLDALRQPIALGGQIFEITASIGIALCLAGETDDAALMRRADAALYEAKGRGRNGYSCDEGGAPEVVHRGRRTADVEAVH